MKVFNIEATNMGNHQQELADKALELVENIDFPEEDDFYRYENELINQACTALGWESAPTTGGFIPEWDGEWKK